MSVSFFLSFFLSFFSPATTCYPVVNKPLSSLKEFSCSSTCYNGGVSTGSKCLFDAAMAQYIFGVVDDLFIHLFLPTRFNFCSLSLPSLPLSLYICIFIYIHTHTERERERERKRERVYFIYEYHKNILWRCINNYLRTRVYFYAHVTSG